MLRATVGLFAEDRRPIDFHRITHPVPALIFHPFGRFDLFICRAIAVVINRPWWCYDLTPSVGELSGYAVFLAHVGYIVLSSHNTVDRTPFPLSDPPPAQRI